MTGAKSFGTGLMLVALSTCAWSAEAEKKTGNTVITSDRLTFDYRRSIAHFTGHVKVVDAQIIIKSDDLTVRFDEESNLRSVTAVGHVWMKQEDKTATCEKAIYDLKKSEVLLVGEAEIRRGKDSVKGDQITFWLNTDKMVCIPGTLVVFPEAGDKEALKLDVLKGKKPDGQRKQ